MFKLKYLVITRHTKLRIIHVEKTFMLKDFHVKKSRISAEPSCLQLRCNRTTLRAIQLISVPIFSASHLLLQQYYSSSRIASISPHFLYESLICH